MATTKNRENTVKTPNSSQRNKSYPSVKFELNLDTDEAQKLARTRLYKASKHAFTLQKLLNKYLTDKDAKIRARTISLNHTLDLVMDQASDDLDSIDTQIKAVIHEVKEKRVKETGQDNLHPLSYSNPTRFNVDNRTNMAQLMCEKLVQIDNIYKNLDFCRHYNLVSLIELVEVEKNATKLIKMLFSSIIRHTNTMERIVKEYKNEKFGDSSTLQIENVGDTGAALQEAEKFDSNVGSEQEQTA